MIGPRRLSDGILYSLLEGRYQKYIADRKTAKSKKFMCYFGNAQGPAASQNVSKPDYDSERDLMGYFSDQVSHPNEKRAKIAGYLAQLGEQADARIISTANADSGMKTNKELIVPLGRFFEFISNFR